MKAVEIKNGIYWVGAIDWDLRNFHGYKTQRGSSYNSYLIIDDKITLIDNVKSHFFKEQLQRISTIVDPAKIDYIIQNHIEMDHSGSLPLILKHCPNAQVFASPKGVEGIPLHYSNNLNLKSVKSGSSLNLGKRTLNFVQTPMVHWPDNMVSYCPEEKILFSNDAFGQHISSSERFDDEYTSSINMYEASKYYANIVLPYGAMVQKALKTVDQLEMEIICPSHGLMWRSHISDILDKYKIWSKNEVVNKALIIYDSMWGSTRKIADTIQDVFEESKFSIRKMNLQHNHISDIMTEVLEAKIICVGSPTLNNNMMPTVSAFLTYFKGLAPKDRIGLAFGSYGWGGQSTAQVEKELKSCGFDLLETIRHQYVPTSSDLVTIKDKVKNQIKEL
ncbi:MAG: FprA family A-type flavoprotein [Deltaproteobacteria bacterium]|jgi:flavorubredoxin|nr:FprA family A-type flavoprotein [Deltaproteobacteria bacterium]